MAGEATSIKEAILRWEARTGEKASEAERIEFQFQWGPIEKMDNNLGLLESCTFLSLSTNSISKIEGLGNMKNLTVLSLGRNNIKSLSGLEVVADTLKELWISYNLIEKTKGIQLMRNLEKLYMVRNLIADWPEVNRIKDLMELRDLSLSGNPIEEGVEWPIWRSQIVKRIPQLIILEGRPLIDI